MLNLIISPIKKKRSLEETVIKIQQGELLLRNELIDKYKPFIAKTVSSVCKRYINESDDEFSIGLIAFNDSIDNFRPEKGSSLLSFADTLIKRSVIDYIRSQNKRLDMNMDLYAISGGDQAQTHLEAEKSIQEYETLMEAERRKEEILRYQKCLKEFDVSFSDLVEKSPKHADARYGAINIANVLVNDDEMKDILLTTKRLPIKQLEEKVSVSRKTIERNRKYIIAVSVILIGEFLFLYEYIKGVIEQ